MPEYRFWNLLAKKISGEATAAEMQELEELMRVHPEYHYAAQHIEDIWGLKTREDHHAAEDSFIRHLNRMKKMGIAPATTTDDEVTQVDSHPKRKKILFIAITAFAALGLLFVLKTIRPTTEAPEAKLSEISTRMGSRSKLVLPEGSTVWLNAGSKLTYNKDFGTSKREVSLVGEAFFDVTHMAELPFVIETPTMEVKVLGTSFNVKAYPNESTTETSVIRGRVEVSPRKRPGEKFVLTANEKLVLSNVQEKNQAEYKQPKTPMVVVGNITYSKKDSTVVETSWVDNKLVFDDEPFISVAAKMERWYGVQMVFNDKKVEQIHLTGTLVNESIQEALEALQLSSNFSGNNFHYHINQNVVSITK